MSYNIQKIKFKELLLNIQCEIFYEVGYGNYLFDNEMDKLCLVYNIYPLLSRDVASVEFSV